MITEEREDYSDYYETDDGGSTEEHKKSFADTVAEALNDSKNQTDELPEEIEAENDEEAEMCCVDGVCSVRRPEKNEDEGEKPIVIEVKRIRKSDVPIPRLSQDNIYCYDICADLTGTPYGNSIYVPPGQTRLIPTNLKFRVPRGYEIQVRPKAGYLDDEIVIRHVPISIAGDSESELKIMVSNIGYKTVNINHGQKISQFIIVPIITSGDIGIVDCSDE